MKMQQLFCWLLLGFLLAISQPLVAIAHPIKADITGGRTSVPIFVTSNFKQTTEVNQSTPGSLFQQLNLSERQKQKIKRIRQQYQAQIVQLKENLQLAQQQLAAMMAGTDSVMVIRAKHEEIAELRQQLATLHFESMLATREILTPQQRQKFAEIMETRQ